MKLGNMMYEYCSRLKRCPSLKNRRARRQTFDKDERVVHGRVALAIDFCGKSAFRGVFISYLLFA